MAISQFYDFLKELDQNGLIFMVLNQS